ncbi:hypothetical protein LCGC14_2703280, partial [marine sediment metagenome]
MEDQRINELATQWLNGNRETTSLEILALPNPAIVASKIVRKLCRMSFEDADRFIRILEATAERKVKCEFCDEEKPGRRTIAGHEE